MSMPNLLLGAAGLLLGLLLGALLTLGLCRSVLRHNAALADGWRNAARLKDQANEQLRRQLRQVANDNIMLQSEKGN